MASPVNTYPEISEPDYVHIRTNFQIYLEALKTDLQQLKKDFVNHTGGFNICFCDSNRTCRKEHWAGKNCEVYIGLSVVRCDSRSIIEKDVPTSQFSQDEIAYLYKFRTSEEVSRYLDKCYELKPKMEWVEEVLRYIELQRPILAALGKIKKDHLENEEKNVKKRVENLCKLVDSSCRVNVEKPLDNSQIRRLATTPQRKKSDLQCKLEEEYYHIMTRIAAIVKKNTPKNVPEKYLQRIKEIVARLPVNPVSSIVPGTGNEADPNN